MTVRVEGLSSFIRHVGRVQAEAKVLDVRVVTTLAVEAKTALLTAASADVPGRRLSRFAKGRGVTLSAGFTIIPGAEPTAVVVPHPAGPWHLLDSGGRAHEIGKPGGFLGNPATGFAATGPVNHPAFAARHTWDKGSIAAVAAGEKSFGHAQRLAYLKLFGG